MISTISLTVRNRSVKLARFVHLVVFGSRNLLLTNALISALMGAAGDCVQQNYDIMMQSIRKEDNKNGPVLDAARTDECSKYCTTRTNHMAAAGLTTGVVTHYWYILLDRYFGSKRSTVLITKKILLDQILFSPVNLFGLLFLCLINIIIIVYFISLVYFTTLGACERSSWRHIKDELMEKGFENIYIAEWLVWPPMQMINFALIPLRYRILFDNVVSFGFDIYSPYVKYKTSLRSEGVTCKPLNDL